MKLRVKLRELAASVSLAAAGVIALSASPAQAFSFATDFTRALSGSDAAKGDVFLNSVILESGEVISDFTLMNSVRIQSNDAITGGNAGGASADIGDLATIGVSQEELTDAGAAAVLNNLNLNNIIDTEDSGSFVMDLLFAQATDKFLLFERGMNSRLNVQALDADGNTIGNLLELANSKNWDYAGFDIDTKEIRNAQKVGSIGISLMDLGVDASTVNALRVSSLGSAFNGPDFKLFSFRSTKRVPEPSMLLGMGVAVVGLLSAGRRRQAKSA